MNRALPTILLVAAAGALTACSTTASSPPSQAIMQSATATATMASPAQGTPPQTAPRNRPTAADRHRVLRISAVGDTLLGNTPAVPSDPVAYLRPIAKDLRWRAGLVFGNLEGTFTTATSSKCAGPNGGDCFAFRTPPAFAEAYARTGFTVLNDANNHSHDFGDTGLAQTVSAIHHAGMKQTGLPGEITVVRADKVKVAICAFAPYSNTADLLDLPAARTLIHRASRKASVVIVYMHAGAEGSTADHITGEEENYDGEDRGNAEAFAHLAINSGADLVIASGPHVMRGMQFYRHHLIAYSLGNFANFNDFSSGDDLNNSGILHVSLSPRGRFLGGRLVSVQLAADGQAAPGPGSVPFVRQLSQADFGATAARFSRSGAIKPPR